MGWPANMDEPTLLLVDGDNLLHDVRGGRDDAGVAWLLPQLRRWRPSALRIVVALDGHPAPGDPSRRRAAPGIEFHHAGRRSADDLIVDLLGEQPLEERARTVVVTRDRALVARVRRSGGLARSVTWLVTELEGRAGSSREAATRRAVSIGQGRPPRHPGVSPAVDAAPGKPAHDPAAADEAPWRPGRGATRKHGNPRRNAKATRRR
jgi:hypothetical protein